MGFIGGVLHATSRLRSCVIKMHKTCIVTIHHQWKYLVQRGHIIIGIFINNVSLSKMKKVYTLILRANCAVGEFADQNLQQHAIGKTPNNWHLLFSQSDDL